MKQAIVSISAHSLRAVLLCGDLIQMNLFGNIICITNHLITGAADMLIILNTCSIKFHQN